MFAYDNHASDLKKKSGEWTPPTYNWINFRVMFGRIEDSPILNHLLFKVWRF